MAFVLDPDTMMGEFRGIGAVKLTREKPINKFREFKCFSISKDSLANLKVGNLFLFYRNTVPHFESFELVELIRINSKTHAKQNTVLELREVNTWESHYCYVSTYTVEWYIRSIVGGEQLKIDLGIDLSSKVLK